MPKLVTLPNIGDIEFPDDATEDQIAEAIQREYPKPPPSQIVGNVGQELQAPQVSPLDRVGVGAMEQSQAEQQPVFVSPESLAFAADQSVPTSGEELAARNYDMLQTPIITEPTGQARLATPREEKKASLIQQQRAVAQNPTGFAQGFIEELGPRLAEGVRGVTQTASGTLRALARVTQKMAEQDPTMAGANHKVYADYAYQLASVIDEEAEKLPQPDRRDFFHDLARGGGQLAGMLAGGLVGKAIGMSQTATATVLGGGLEFDDAYDAAIEKGDDPDTAFAKSLGYATIAGLIENRLGAGRILRKYFPTANAAAQSLTKWGVSKEILKNFISGFGEEAAQRFAQNWIVQEKPGMEGVLYEGLIGSILQGTVGLPSAAIGPATEAWNNAREEVRVNASQNAQAAEVYGNMRPQRIEGEGQVPVEEGGQGVQPQAERGISREKAQVEPTSPVELGKQVASSLGLRFETGEAPVIMESPKGTRIRLEDPLTDSSFTFKQGANYDAIEATVKAKLEASRQKFAEGGPYTAKDGRKYTIAKGENGQWKREYVQPEQKGGEPIEIKRQEVLSDKAEIPAEGKKATELPREGLNVAKLAVGEGETLTPTVRVVDESGKTRYFAGASHAEALRKVAEAGISPFIEEGQYGFLHNGKFVSRKSGGDVFKRLTGKTPEGMVAKGELTSEILKSSGMLKHVEQAGEVAAEEQAPVAEEAPVANKLWKKVEAEKKANKYGNRSGWLIAVQAPQGDVKGYVQVVDVLSSQTTRKVTLDKSAPDFSGLPTGTYTYGEALQKLVEVKKGSAAKTAEQAYNEVLKKVQEQEVDFEFVDARTGDTKSVKLKGQLAERAIKRLRATFDQLNVIRKCLGS